jgi:hypothetical protein
MMNHKAAKMVLPREKNRLDGGVRGEGGLDMVKCGLETN